MQDTPHYYTFCILFQRMGMDRMVEPGRAD